MLAVDGAILRQPPDRPRLQPHQQAQGYHPTQEDLPQLRLLLPQPPLRCQYVQVNALQHQENMESNLLYSQGCNG